MTNVIEEILGVVPGSALAEALQQRQEIMRLSQASHDAVIIPREPGGLSHAERAALAARMAHQNREEALAALYATRVDGAALRPIAGGADAPSADRRLAAIVRHVDLLTRSPRDATKGDIEALTAAGLSEPDIVRLSELIAFVNYQVRVIAGLRLLKGAA